MQIENFLSGANNTGCNCSNNIATNATSNTSVLGDIDQQIKNLGVNGCPTDNQVLGTQAARTIEVPEVLGVAEGSTCVEVCIPVLPPGLAILEDLIQRTLVFDALVASNNRVFINGRLIKRIPFETLDQTATPTTGSISRISLSNVRSITVEVPFFICFELQGAVAGTTVVVLSSTVNGVELPNLHCPNQTMIRSIIEKDFIAVRVKVVRDTMITVPNVSTANI